MAIINFLRSDENDLSSVALRDGQVVFSIDGEEVTMYHDFESDGVLKRVPVSGGTSVTTSGERLIFG